MTPQEYIKSFEKYIEVIIMPANPEIKSFDVTYSEINKSWTFTNMGWVDVYNIFFYVDGTDEEFERRISKSLSNMKKLFSIKNDPASVTS